MMNIQKIVEFIDSTIKQGYSYDPNELDKFSREEMVELLCLLILRVESREMELENMVDTLETRVTERTQELEDKNRKLNELAINDGLTMIRNRRYFNEKLGEYSLLSLRTGLPLGCIMCDIDHFKRVNDNYGHQVGDAILKELAHILRHNIRGTDICARYGGEEFVMLLPNTTVRTGYNLANKLWQAVRENIFEANGDTYRITCSFGLTSGIRKDELYENLVKRADEALYRAKRGGRDRVCSEPVIDC